LREVFKSGAFALAKALKISPGLKINVALARYIALAHISILDFCLFEQKYLSKKQTKKLLAKY
jgi:hypothetical protein